MNKRSYYFNQGKYKEIALVFSAPGKHEEFEGRPIANETGENFKDLLAKFHESEDDELKIFKKYNDIYDFRITNSVSKIEYLKKTKKTEPRNKEINESHNLERLKGELNDISKYIICFGKKAQYAVNKIKTSLNKNKDVKIIYTRHLSPRAFNTIKGLKNKEERLKYYFDSIKSQL